MDVPPIIIAIWTSAGACLLAGGVLSAWATFARPKPRLNDGPDAARSDPEACCPYCGYSSRGLETDTCPECGQSMAGALAAHHLRRRIAAGMVGVLLLLASATGPLLDHGYRVGWLNALPTEALAFIAEHVPATRQRVLHTLAGRADAGGLSSSEQRDVSELIERMLDRETRTTVRREAAGLLRSIAGEMRDSCAAAAIRDRDPVVRQHGVQALSRSAQADRVVTTTLVRVIACDRNDRVRREAVEALRVRGLGDPRRAHALRAALDDSSPSVQIRAMYAIGDATSVSLSAVLAISAKLVTGDEHVREAAAWTIARISSRHGVDQDLALGLLLPRGRAEDRSFMKTFTRRESWEIEWDALPVPLARTM